MAGPLGQNGVLPRKSFSEKLVYSRPHCANIRALVPQALVQSTVAGAELADAAWHDSLNLTRLTWDFDRVKDPATL